MDKPKVDRIIKEIHSIQLQITALKLTDSDKSHITKSLDLVSVIIKKYDNSRKLGQKKFIVCETCGAYLLEKNITKHKTKHTTKNEYNTKKNELLDTKETIKSTAKEIRQALVESELKKDKEIYIYLKNNPINPIGKFGVPQDKYRWGFYGSHSMEYDIWRKGDK